MYALWKTQGATAQPWREDLRFGAVRKGAGMAMMVCARKPWIGKVLPDRARHKLLMHLPFDYTRINQFPEWFVVVPEKQYLVEVFGRAPKQITCSGQSLLNGLDLELEANEAMYIEVRPR